MSSYGDFWHTRLMFRFNNGNINHGKSGPQLRKGAGRPVLLAALLHGAFVLLVIFAYLFSSFAVISPTEQTVQVQPLAALQLPKVAKPAAIHTKSRENKTKRAGTAKKLQQNIIAARKAQLRQQNAAAQRRKAQEIAQLKKVKAIAEKKRAAKQLAKAQALLKQRQKAKMQAALLAKLQQMQRKQALANQATELAALQQAQRQAQERAAAARVVNQYTQKIIASISQHWLLPANFDRKQSCLLAIKLAPGGVVLDVKLIESSGNILLDRSAVAAVYRASPLPVPSGADFAAFRDINLHVQPLTFSG